MAHSKYIFKPSAVRNGRIDGYCLKAEQENARQLRHTECPNVIEPLSSYFVEEPDWELELVKIGLARVRADSVAPDQLVQAEVEARANRKGRWSNAHIRPSPSPPPWMPHDLELPRRPSLLPRRFLYTFILTSLLVVLVGSVAYLMGGKLLLFSFIFASGIGGIAGTVNVWLRWRLNCYVNLAVIGAPESGKTWLLHRLAHQDADEESFAKLGPSSGVESFAPEEPFAIGAKEIFPVFVDHPGGQPQTQARSMYEPTGLRAWLARLRCERRVWMIVIAPGRGKIVDMRDTSAEQLKFLGQQRSTFALPCGLVGSGLSKPPDAIIVVLNKFDAVSDRRPEDAPGTREALKQIFAKDLGIIQHVCETRDIPQPDDVVVCSALKDWNIDKLRTAIGKLT